MYTDILANFRSACTARIETYTLPPKSLPIPISVYVIKHACYSELGEGQGEGQHLCKLGTFLTKL